MREIPHKERERETQREKHTQRERETHAMREKKRETHSKRERERERKYVCVYVFSTTNPTLQETNLTRKLTSTHNTQSE